MLHSYLSLDVSNDHRLNQAALDTVFAQVEAANALAVGEHKHAETSGDTSANSAPESPARRSDGHGVDEVMSVARGAAAADESDKKAANRAPWSAAELRALRSGVTKHGIGNWRELLGDQTFLQQVPGRTAKAIRDRFYKMAPRSVSVDLV